MFLQVLVWAFTPSAGRPGCAFTRVSQFSALRHIGLRAFLDPQQHLSCHDERNRIQ